mmetsp:Transcript_20307/g.34906  ORF Transcript_20307/g.34906 Transcript_20307/m.34906 type:complete len:257 (-) Transcript_20307:254-1024(-)|eukprot:CAMPEP_0183712168 /NCGR_PEP_ID=MMETSP0737-20130205/7381_1 /TAXON_ID=385413 /ORGANISM="Thalassiosira miniscula, Strain CCMP1093" /LENGTH=256 /DNA_ID=CAMNT_0025940747 /DNA_START=238 /DNA_END=1008 /DNA_ORIENTATION=+
MDNTTNSRDENNGDDDRIMRQGRMIDNVPRTPRNSLAANPPPPRPPPSSSPSDWLNRYNKLLDQYPLRTKMITSFCVSAFGSALGSYLSATAKENRRAANNNRQSTSSTAKSQSSILSKINWVDVLSYAIHGGLINAPISHYWFEWLSVHGPSSNTKSVLVDQLAVQPPLLMLMFVCLDVLRANIRATIHQFREASVISNSVTNALQVVPNSWRFWPFAVYFTFKYLKKKHYTVALNLCSVAWTVYLSRGAGAAED